MQLKSHAMYKQSPSRNQRSNKGTKVKHVLQICLLLAVCFWLIYQVKHSHDKKKEFDEHDAKGSLDSISKDEIVKLGRKDLHPLKEDTVAESDKHDEVEDEETEEETPVEEENEKHEDEGNENKDEEKDENDEGRGGVEEEVDDQDQEKSDVENDQEEDSVDEEKERDNDDEQELKDKEYDDKKGQTDTGSDSQEQDNEGGARRRHEAREENYKADDASSAVTSDNQITSNGNETVVLAQSNEHGEINSSEPQNHLYHIDGVDADRSASVEGGETINEGHLGTATNEKSEMTAVSTTHGNSTEDTGEVPDFSLLNGNRTAEHNDEQSVVEMHEKSSLSSKLDGKDSNSEGNSTNPVSSDVQDFNSTVSSQFKSTNPKPEESHTRSVTESSNSEIKDNVTSKEEANSTVTENGSVVEDPEDDESKSKSSYDMELDSENSSDSTLSLEEKDVRTDLGTLPDIKNESSNSEEDVAEE